MRLPNGARAILDARKLVDYCLNPDSPRGRHKARVFASSRGGGDGPAKETHQTASHCRVTEDLPDRKLKRGEVGTVVEILAPDVYEVEFSDDDGQTYAELALIGREGISQRSTPSSA